MSGPKLAGAVLVAAMLGVWAVRAFIDPDSTDATPIATSPMTADGKAAEPWTTAPTSPPHVVAVDELAGVPVGYPQSDRGATTAAVNWVASFPTIVRMGPIRLTDTITALLSERRAASGTEEVVADYFTLIDELGPDFARRVWIESPLQVDVMETTATNAVVAVWSLLVTGDPDIGPVEALWRTHRIELVWERDDWRIDDVTITEGPTPIPTEVALPSPASDFVTIDTWQPAVFADTTTGEAG